MGKHATHAGHNPTHNTQGEHVSILRVLFYVCKTYKGFFGTNPKHSEAPWQFQLTTKHYLIMNEIRDDDRIMQIATERGDSCGDRRHAILLTAHSTFTQQTEYTDNMATLNERQFFLLLQHMVARCSALASPVLGSTRCAQQMKEVGTVQF